MRKATNNLKSILYVLACLVIASCGGSSGGGGGDGGDDTAVIPEVLNFTLNVDDSDPFTLTYSTAPSDAIFVIGTPSPMAGTYNTDTGAWTLSSPNFFNITTDRWDEPEASFSIQVTSAFSADAESYPNAGALQIVDGVNTITVTVVNTPQPGVRIAQNGGSTEFYSWSNFFSLLGSTESDWKKEASLAYYALNVLMREILSMADSLAIIEENIDELEAETLITYLADAFPPGMAPAGVPQQGELTLRWTDTSGNSSLGPGDDFSWVFGNCWEDNATGDDLLYVGSVRMLGFTENSEDRNGTETITLIGFSPYEDDPGGVSYEDYTTFITKETATGYELEDRALIYNGGFSLLFSE